VTVVERCLAKDPAERYESTRDLARDLKSVADSVSRRTPEGDSRSSLGEGGTTPASKRGRLAATAAIAILAAAALAAWLWRPGTAAPVQEVDRPLIAVRPFRSLSADPQQGYFAAGMTEEIRGQLSQVSSLRLLSRNGLDRYSDDVARAVRELGVGKIVDGTVRVDGKRVRVSAELVDATSQQTLWSDQYDRDLAGMLAVQSDIAQQIARALHASLSPHERRRLEQRLTDNVEAYSLYLQSQELRSTDRARNLEAVSLLRKALTLDPRFATAQARIGYRLVFMGNYDDASYIDKGIAEAEAALRIDPGLPMGHFVLGTAYGMKGMDAQSRQAFLRALELDPNSTSAMNNLSIEERIHGRLDEGLYWGRRAFTLSGKAAGGLFHLIVPMLDLRADAVNRMLLEEGERRFPDNARLQSVLAMLDLLEGQSERAVSRTNALVARAPRNEEVKFHRADLAFLLDAPDLEAALEPLMQQSASNYSFWGVALSARLRYAYALGKRGESAKAAALIAEAERIARERIDAGNQTPGLRVELAAAAALRKDTNAAIDWLERAFEGGYRNYGFLERDPILLAQLRTDARFHDVLERMRRDVEAQRARARTRGLLDVEPLLGPAK
jgi:TolB-like protein